jgi:membrane-associated protease RseP (regulator of RpoE activity)
VLIMKNGIVLGVICASVFLSGCASSKKEAVATKPIFERPWIGGHFEMAYTPRSARTNTAIAGKYGALISNLHTNAPLQKAGLQESDLVLAVNGKKVRTERDIHQRVEKTGMNPATFTVYREGAVLEKSVTPGKELYQNWRAVIFALGLGTHFDVKLWPSPDFSLVALGYDEEPKRLDLEDATSKFYIAENKRNGNPGEKEGWLGLRSEEGWKTWLGPISFEKRRMIVSQE